MLAPRARLQRKGRTSLAMLKWAKRRVVSNEDPVQKSRHPPLLESSGINRNASSQTYCLERAAQPAGLWRGASSSASPTPWCAPSPSVLTPLPSALGTAQALAHAHC
eukprot:939491-Prorocentrum_minimum.AAC.1